MKLSIIMPAYNEEKRIGRTLEEYSKEFEALRKRKLLDYNLLVVINGTTDNTEKIVKSFRKKNNRITYLNLKEGGKGHAIIQGFKHELKGNSDLIGFVDADMSTLPKEFFRLASQVKHYDGVIASRYHKKSAVEPKPTLQRMIASRIFNLWIRTLFIFPYRDTQCGAKIFKKYALKKVVDSLLVTKWAFDVDLLYNLRKHRFKINEVPTTWSDKEYSKINFMRSGPFMALSMLRLRLLNSPFKSIVRLYDIMPAWIKIHNKFR
jgi:glycosyltransferase involved in cell wall biosynthesis